MTEEERVNALSSSFPVSQPFCHLSCPQSSVSCLFSQEPQGCVRDVQSPDHGRRSVRGLRNGYSGTCPLAFKAPMSESCADGRKGSGARATQVKGDEGE
eukprot:760130-Hanusia_phi.AAC.2